MTTRATPVRTRLVPALVALMVMFALMTMVAAGSARAAVILVSPNDPAAVNIAKMEGAGAGDEVVVAPGTYRFRLYLEAHGTAAQPIVIRAADPARPAGVGSRRRHHRELARDVRRR